MTRLAPRFIARSTKPDILSIFDVVTTLMISKELPGHAFLKFSMFRMTLDKLMPPRNSFLVNGSAMSSETERFVTPAATIFAASWVCRSKPFV